MTDAQVVHVVDDDESARESLAFLLESRLALWGIVRVDAL